MAIPRTSPRARFRAARRHPARRQHSTLRTSAIRARDWRPAPVCQASRHEPNRLVQGRRHDRCLDFRPPGRIPLGGVRFHRQHVRIHGRVCRARRYAQFGPRAQRQNLVEQVIAGPRLRRAYLPASHRFRRMPPLAPGTGAARSGLPVEFHQPVSYRRAENSRARIAGTARLAATRPHHCARRQPRQQFSHREGPSRNARSWPDSASAEVVCHSS